MIIFEPKDFNLDEKIRENFCCYCKHNDEENCGIGYLCNSAEEIKKKYIEHIIEIATTNLILECEGKNEFNNRRCS